MLHCPDGLTGLPTDDPVQQEVRMELADLCFRGSTAMAGPLMPLPRVEMTEQKRERCQRWLRAKIAKLKGKQ